MADQNHERAVEQYNGIIDTQLAEIARLKAECQARQAENSVLAVECDSLKAEVERLTGELGELEGIRSYLKWNGLQADLKDWLDWRSGKNGSEIPFPKDYLPPKQ